jgi:hypothetical protein
MKKRILGAAFAVATLFVIGLSLNTANVEAKQLPETRTNFSCFNVDNPYCCLLGDGNCLPPIVIGG